MGEPSNVDIRGMKTLNRQDEEIIPERAVCAVQELRDLPVIDGIFMKLGQSWMGLGEAKWRERYVILDPRTGNLAYWDMKNATSKRQAEALADTPPKHEYALEDLICLRRMSITTPSC